MQKLLLFLVLALVCCANLLPAQTAARQEPPATGATASGNVEPRKDADIRRLLQATGAENLALQMMNSTETNVRPTLENSFPPGEYRSKLIDLFLEKFRSKATPEALLALIIPIYDRYFSDDEIKQLTAFYETPVGKKAVSALPQVIAESQQAGKAWGEKLGEESMEEVLAEHPDLQKAMEEAQKANH